MFKVYLFSKPCSFLCALANTPPTEWVTDIFHNKCSIYPALLPFNESMIPTILMQFADDGSYHEIYPSTHSSGFMFISEPISCISSIDGRLIVDDKRHIMTRNDNVKGKATPPYTFDKYTGNVFQLSCSKSSLVVCMTDGLLSYNQDSFIQHWKNTIINLKVLLDYETVQAHFTNCLDLFAMRFSNELEPGTYFIERENEQVIGLSSSGSSKIVDLNEFGDSAFDSSYSPANLHRLFLIADRLAFPRNYGTMTALAGLDSMKMTIPKLSRHEFFSFIRKPQVESLRYLMELSDI